MIVDCHTHPVMIAELTEADPALACSVRDVFGLLFPPQPLQTFLLELDAAGVDRAVLLPLDCTSAHGCRLVTNEQVAALAAWHSCFIGFASVDPNLPDAVPTLRAAVRDLGLCGLHLDPALQRFRLDSRDQAYPLYEAACDLGIPVLVDCGMSWAPLGQTALAHPLALEQVVQDLPELRLIIAGFAWPWFNEALTLALKHQNVYLDTSIVYSGTPADALRHVLAGQIGLSVLERSLSRQVLFGSDYPRADIRRSVRGLRSLGLSPALEAAVLGGNALAVLPALQAARPTADGLLSDRHAENAR